MQLSVIVPAYNEENRIIGTLEKIDNYLNKQKYLSEILVVDDGSNDNTVNLVREFTSNHSRCKLLKNSRNQGKGAAVQKGVLHARGEFILFSDADLSSPIEEVERLFYWFYQGYEVVIGSRNVYDPLVKIDNLVQRKFIGKVFNSIVQAFTLPQFKDTQCGFKAFKKDIAKQLFSQQKLMGFSFDVEILYLAVKNGFLCKEVAVNWKHCTSSKVSIFRDSFRMFNDIIKIKKLHKNTFISIPEKVIHNTDKLVSSGINK